MNINHIHNAYARIPKIIQKFQNFKLQNHFENVSYLCHNIRKYTQQSIPSTYSHWQINEYGNTDKLSLINDVPIPIVRNRNEVLIKVHASSVNPIDTRMLRKYYTYLILYNMLVYLIYKTSVHLQTIVEIINHMKSLCTISFLVKL